MYLITLENCGLLSSIYLQPPELKLAVFTAMDISINQVVSDGSTTLCGCAFSSSSETWYTGNSLGEIESLTQGSSGCEADEDAITAIAVSPDGADMILGFQNKVSSRHVNNPSDENHGQLMRTNLAARQIEFNSTGSHV